MVFDRTLRFPCEEIVSRYRVDGHVVEIEFGDDGNPLNDITIELGLIAHSASSK